jgi:hypothetical protein
MASKYLEIVNFLKNMAIANKTIAHTAAIAGSSRVRNSFITIEDEDALGAAVETAIDFPCMVMVKLSGRLIDKQQDYRKLWNNTLFFLAKIDTTIAEATAKSNVMEQTEAVMNQFISKLWNIMEEEGTCGPFREIDLANFFFTPTDRIKDNFYGWRLSFATEANAPDILNYDDSQWNSI